MLPEIALSEQWLARFKKNFGFYPWFEFKVKLSEKRKIWNIAFKKTVSLVVVGTILFFFYLYQFRSNNYR